MNRIMTNPIFILFPIFFLFFNSCASAPKKYELSKIIDESSSEVTIDNLTVTVRPVTETSLNKEIFHTNLIDKGLIPIYLSIVNNDPTNKFVLQINHCKLSNRKSFSTDDAYSEAKLSDGSQSIMESTSLVGAALLFAPVLAINSAIVKNIGEMKQSLLENQYKEKIIRPNESNSGFLYFNIGVSKDDTIEKDLQLEFMNMENKKPIKFNFPVKLGD